MMNRKNDVCVNHKSKLCLQRPKHHANHLHQPNVVLRSALSEILPLASIHPHGPGTNVLYVRAYGV